MKASTSRSALAGTSAYQGMNWISQKKRLAIYLRDGLACAWCGVGVEGGETKLTLDHVIPYSKGGGNGETNLVTCCSRCNSSRGNRSKKAFAIAVAAYVNHGTTAEAILDFIKVTVKRTLPIFEAAALIERRGSAAKVIAANAQNR